MTDTKDQAECVCGACGAKGHVKRFCRTGLPDTATSKTKNKRRSKSQPPRNCGFCNRPCGGPQGRYQCERYLMSDAAWLKFTESYAKIMAGDDEQLKAHLRDLYFPTGS